MAINNFYHLLKKEVNDIDKHGISKRHEKIISGFTKDKNPQAIIKNKKYYLFNSNDYLGLRFNQSLKKAENIASKKYGVGPGAVRFISGTLKIHIELEKEIAHFHKKEAGMIFSSAFATNLGVIFPLIIGQRKNTFICDKVLVISDELNHRSIIDAIRLAKLSEDNRAIFKHLDYNHLELIIKKAIGNYDRLIIITDGVFSMLGEIANLKKIVELKNKYDQKFKNGILIVVDDAHGVGVLGETGQGSEEYNQAKVDVLIGTFGKAFGTDGGYVVSNKIIINYLKESSATYIYSNNLTPATAAASLKSIKIASSKIGFNLRKKLFENINHFKNMAKKLNIPLAANSHHPIQPVFIGDPIKTKKIVNQLFKNCFLTTPISYPVVPLGKDEIRIQLSAIHNKKIISNLLIILAKLLKNK